MPIYVYRCSSSGERFERVCSIAEHSNTVTCNCGVPAGQILTPLHVVPDIEPYRSVVTGERIKGRAHHKQHLRDHNLIEVGNERIDTPRAELPPVGPDIKRAIEEVRSR